MKRKTLRSGNLAGVGPPDEATPAAVSNITHAIVGHHEAVLETDQRWVRFYDNVSSTARTIWSAMSYHTRQAWVAHHHQLRAEGLRWAVEEGPWAALEGEAVEALSAEWLQRHPQYRSFLALSNDVIRV